MAWFLSPSGWPTFADDGSLFAARLAETGWTPLAEADVPAAIAAYNASSPLPPQSYDFLTEPGAAVALVGAGPLGTAARGAYAALDATGRVRAAQLPPPPDATPALVRYGTNVDATDLPDGTLIAELPAGFPA